jgi:hypothetical protein
MHFRGNPAPALHCSKDILPCIFRHLAPSWNATLEPCKILHIFTITNSNNASPRCKTINGWRQFKAAMGHQLSTFGGRQDASRTCEHKAQQISLNRFRRQEIYVIIRYYTLYPCRLSSLLSALGQMTTSTPKPYIVLVS